MSHARRPVLEPIVANTPRRRQRQDRSTSSATQAASLRRIDNASTYRDNQNQDPDFSPSLSHRSSGSAQSSPASSPHQRKVAAGGGASGHSLRKMQIEEGEKARAARAGLKRKRGGGSGGGLGSRTNLVAAEMRSSPQPSTSKTPSGYSRRSKSRTRGETALPAATGNKDQRPVAVSHGSTSSLRNTMTRLELSDGSQDSGRRPMRRSASSPTGRRTLPIRKASWNQRPASSDHEASGEDHGHAPGAQSDDDFEEDETEEHQYTEGNEVSFRQTATFAQLMRLRLTHLSRINEDIGGDPWAVTKRDLGLSIIAARSRAESRESRRASSSRKAPHSVSSEYTDTSSNAEDKETSATHQTGRSVRGGKELCKSKGTSAVSPAVRRVRMANNSPATFAKSSPVRTRARARTSCGSRKSFQPSRLAQGPSPRLARTAPGRRKRNKRVAFSANDLRPSRRRAQGDGDGAGALSNASDENEEDSHGQRLTDDEDMEDSQDEYSSESFDEADPAGDSTFVIEEDEDLDQAEDDSMNVDADSPALPITRRASATLNKSRQQDIRSSLIAAREASRSQRAMAPPRISARAQSDSKDTRRRTSRSKGARDTDAATLDTVARVSDEEMAICSSPTKMRKLRNGKQLRLQRSRGEISSPASESDDEAELESLRSSHSAGSGHEHHEDAPGSEDEAEEEEDDMMADPTSAKLSRLRLARLSALCEERDIPSQAKKAILVDRLLQWFKKQLRDEAGSLSDEAAPRSSSSISTVKPDDSQDEDVPPAAATKVRAGGRQAAKVRAVVVGAPSRKKSASHTPLLLRSTSKEPNSRPPSPVLDEDHQDAQPAEAVDELNGLDLEMLNLTDKEIAPFKLEKLDKIGSGGYKDVYIGNYRPSATASATNRGRAMKVAIADIRDDLTEMDIKELSLLRDLKHENIVRFIGVSIPEPPRHVPCMIVSEICTNGDLFDYVRNVEPPPAEEIFRIMLETAKGIEYLHSRDPAIIHRDIKSTNILVTSKKVVKINDFGLARVKNTRRSMMRSLVGTVNWQAAELWVPKPNYNEKVDVWSVAMTFWETLQWHEKVKKYPFEGMNEHQIYLEVGGPKRVRPKTASIRKRHGEGIVNLLDRMWDANPRNRPNMLGVVEELERLLEGIRER